MNEDLLRTIEEDSGFDISINITLDKESETESPATIDEVCVLTNFDYWNRETNPLSTNNFDSAWFRKIVSLGENAVPTIYRLISKKPHPIVQALDQIYPGMMTYKGNVTLEEVCEAWTTTLLLLGKI